MIGAFVFVFGLIALGELMGAVNFFALLLIVVALTVMYIVYGERE